LQVHRGANQAICFSEGQVVEMFRVLVVHHDPDIADQQASSLRRAGYEVVQCSGPVYAPCPVMHGHVCPAVEDADVLVYDVWSVGDSDGGRSLVEGLREQHPNIPIVLDAPGMELEWVETTGVHAVVPLVGQPSGKSLIAAVETALQSRSASPQGYATS
jgi:hypothetical protein